MIEKFGVIAGGFLIVLSFAACRTVETEPEKAKVRRLGQEIFIEDRTGKRWNVTHAVENYEFVASEFQFGLGPRAIPPILNPEFLSPGDAGYPAGDLTFIVIGTAIGGDSRAYPITILGSHEVVDETFGDVHVAVGW